MTRAATTRADQIATIEQIGRTTMTARLHVVDASADTAPEPTPDATARLLVEVAAEVAEDAVSRAPRYLDETVVPAGGE